MTIPLSPSGLSRDQVHLAQILKDRGDRFGSRLADIYVGAIVAMNDDTRPDHLAHAAHGMREVLEKLPLHYDGALTRVPIANVSGGARKLAAELVRAQQQSECYASGSPAWTGQIDVHVQRLLDHVEALAVEVGRFPTKPEIRQRFLRSLDPINPNEPIPGESDQLREWERIEKFFIRIAHHDRSATRTEFETCVTECTSMILQLLRPPTSDIMQQLDGIIEGGA